MRLLLHTCCAPCSIYPVDTLREQGFDLYGYFYNPNIHPYTEFARRRDTLAEYAGKAGLKMIFDGEYRLEEFLREIAHREAVRCRFCYAMRLEQAARVAKKGKFDCFSTTLLVSPYQKHALIRETGEAMGEKHGIPFYYYDFRPGYRTAAARSRELGFYRQQYCGCIYSEKERFYRPVQPVNKEVGK
ncbi:MAG: epoxyqueuosine reductase QueH [Firmicutes bacterium]|nr:epoxyqueuosine reductase QueH [Bacillota bacterium]